MKLNVLLAKTDHMASSYKRQIQDFLGFFKNTQKAFKGEKKTYVARPNTIDEPNKRGNTIVVTTVSEKLKWLEETVGPYIDALFSQERTNASGTAKAKLVVDGVDFGELTSLELLKLKSLIEHGELEQMYANIPVRPDDEIWVKTKAEEYKNREIYEGELFRGVNKTTETESYILPDPNIDKLGDGVKYNPITASKRTIVELGDYTTQKFSGEWSHRERAELLRRRTTLLNAVVEALKTANEVEAVPSSVTAKKIFGYLHSLQ